MLKFAAGVETAVGIGERERERERAKKTEAEKYKYNVPLLVLLVRASKTGVCSLVREKNKNRVSVRRRAFRISHRSVGETYMMYGARPSRRLATETGTTFIARGPGEIVGTTAAAAGI